jgi:F0F1-type ATP synthase assembly protein I
MDRPTLRALGLVSGLGFAIAGPFIVFLFTGRWLDDRFGMSPLFLLLGLLLGFIAAGATIAELLRFQSTGQTRLRRRRPPRPPTTPDDLDRRDREES